ncbi:MAG: FAD-dependent oxidoreductase, partial [Faecalibacillus sp.]
FMAFPIPGTPQLIAPSHVGPYYAKEAPRAVTREELKVIIRQFGEAAHRFQLAGGDGVEIQAAHAHGLLGGFLTPLYNKRTDEYGGDINGRLRLTLEVIQEIRKTCGDDFIIDVRISGDEYSDGGLTLNDMIYVSKQLEKAGVDFIHVSGGNTIKRGSSMPAPGTSPAPHMHSSEEIKKYVNIPVATVARINEPWIAEELIANGKADICLIGRPNLCDSEFANKAYAGLVEDIRPCIGCGRCLTGIMFGQPIGCTVNPSVQSNDIEKADVKKKVLVIGGGPAGMEAAYVASRRGREVVLCEKEGELGGQLRVAAVLIGKQELCKVIKFMTRCLEHEGVDVRLNTEVTNEMLNDELKDYEVICSMGAKPKEIEAFKVFKQTMTADEVLSGKKYPGRKIVIIGGGSVGCETADYLAPLINDLFPANRDVTVIEMTPSLMTGEGGPAKSALTQRLMRKGVKLEMKATIKAVDETTITYEKNGQEYVIDDADTLIFAVGYDSIKIDNDRIHVIGDSAKVGNLKDAITGAYEFAKKL